jgi:hypothetical protein
MTRRGLRFADDADHIDTLYHESTHAYLDNHSNDSNVASLVRVARLHYNGAKLTTEQGAIVGDVDDTGRLVSEAAGEYVGHRISTWAATRQLLQTLADDPEVRPEALTEPEIDKIRTRYDTEMARRTFGYEREGFFGGITGWVDRPMQEDMRQWLDRTILEGRVADRFENDPTFGRLVERIRQRRGRQQ